MLIDTAENITIAEKTYQSLYKYLEQNLYLTVENLSSEEFAEIKDDFNRENFWAKHVVHELDCWIAFFFSKGRFPGSQKLIMLPQADIPDFIKTEAPLLPIDLYKKFKATDAKALASIQVIAALNIHLGGDRNISKKALTEFLCNLTFQALSKENDDILLSFEHAGNLFLDILESLAKIDQHMVNDSKILCENLKEELNKTEYELDLLPELEIQEDLAKYQKEGKSPLWPPKPFSSSTPLKTKEINKIYDEEKENYLQTAITINKTDFDVAVENAEENSKEVINDIIGSIPGLIVDDKLNLDKLFEYNSNDLERTSDLSNQVQERLDKLLSLMKENTRPSIDMWMTEKPTEELPNNSLSGEKSDIKTEDIYIDGNYLDNIQFFPKPSTDDKI